MPAKPSRRRAPSRRFRASHPRRQAGNQRRRPSRWRPLLEQLESRRLLTLDAVFEIDGDATQSVPGSHDWDQVYSDVVSNTLPPNSAGTSVTEFVTDPTNSHRDSVFAHGGSKHVRDISHWRWKEGRVPSKTDLADGFAAVYEQDGFESNGDTHTLAYVGADRWSNRGSTAVGVWFLQNPIAQGTEGELDGRFVNPDTNQVAKHEVGDVLVIAKFYGWGRYVKLTAYQWTDRWGGSLSDPIPLTSERAIAAVNSRTIDVPWEFEDKRGSTSPQRSEFIEIGVDMNELLAAAQQDHKDHKAHKWWNHHDDEDDDRKEECDEDDKKHKDDKKDKDRKKDKDDKDDDNWFKHKLFGGRGRDDDDDDDDHDHDDDDDDTRHCDVDNTPVEAPDFASFMITTSASHSIHSRLKDFIIGDLRSEKDVAVNKTALDGEVFVGEEVGFNIEVSNVGDEFLENVTLVDQYPSGPLPAGANNDILWTIPAGANPSGQFVLSGDTAGSQTLSLAPNTTLDVNESISVQIVGVATAPGLLVNTAGVSADDEGPGVLNNNVDTAEIAIGINFGSISGTKYEDVNGNGVRDAGEDGLAGWTFYLDENNNGAIDAGEPTADSDSSGRYNFPELAPGTYAVGEVQQAGWIQTSTDPSAIVVEGGVDVEGVDFGNFELGTIRGLKFEDNDGDSRQDADDGGLSGWTIQLIDPASGAVLDTQTTGASGGYAFDSLGPGDYRVREVQQSGWVQTTDDPADIAIRSGSRVDDVKFGNAELGSIAGVKFEDLDGDGQRDNGEAGLGNWTFFLDLNDNDSLDGGEPTAVSDANGNYQFTDLPPGAYQVLEQDQSGWLQTTSDPAAIQLTSGSDVTDVHFGNFELTTLAGVKFNDINGDGRRQSDEPGLPNWTIRLSDGNTTVEQTTDAQGRYAFTDLGPGNYQLAEAQQAGWVQTTADPAPIANVSGQNVDGLDFGNFQLISISGAKFEDVDGDGTRDAGEVNLPNWEIRLLDGNDNLLQTVQTDADGEYSFAGLGPGEYQVRETQQSGWLQTTTMPAAIVAASGVDVGNVEFGNFELGSVRGVKFEDNDGDGTRDANDGGLSGWTIQLIDPASGDVLSTQTTNASGAYQFENLRQGEYRVREVQQDGWEQTTDNPADIVILSGANITGVNFGNAELGSIAGVKFEDLDGDGQRDNGEPGLGNWTFFLDLNQNDSLDAGEPTASSDANGAYKFTDVSPGDYLVREQGRAGWLQTTTDPAAIQLRSGSEITGVDFGNFELTTLAGVKFNDLNGDGRRQSGEPGLPNWTIRLSDGSTTVEQTTDAQGRYVFADLGPGDYEITEAAQSGWVQTTADPAPIANVSGQDVDGLDFGNFQLISISGAKFEDLDGDGTRDAGEVNLPNWEIRLLDGDDNLLQTIQTNANGEYAFVGLGPGEYQVLETQQPGWLQTTSSPAPIVAVSGADVAGVEFGNFELFDISGTKFGDVNVNGSRESGEPGLGGWTIYLDANNNDALDPGEVRTTTAADGSYQFSDLGPGSYIVREQLQAGWVQTAPADGFYAITGVSGVSVASADFGNVLLTDVAGVKFEDLDGDGTRDVGEPGVGGWIITLDLNRDGTLDRRTVTADDGSYQFTQVPPGDHRVAETSRPGWEQSAPASGVYDIAAGGGSIAGLDFGNYRVSSISGVKFNDLAGDGQRQAEDSGLAAWTIQLLASDDSVVDSVVTDANGEFAFDNVAPGAYRVREVQQTGWLQTTADPANLTIVSGTNVSGLEFGNFQLVTLSGVKFNDADVDGVRDSGEPGLSGWTIELDLNNDQSVDLTTVTDASGAYEFVHVGPGTHRITEVQQDGWEQSVPSSGDYVVTTASGADAAGLDFGNFATSFVRGRKLNDFNGNGQVDPGEGGIANVTIVLTGTDVLGNDVRLEAKSRADNPQTPEDESGLYEIAGVVPGDYVVEEIIPEGYTQTFPAAGNYTIRVESGDDLEGIDFANAFQGLRYDFDATESGPTEEGFVQVLPTDTFAELGYGWAEPLLGDGSISRGGFNRGSGVSNINDDLVLDGHFSSNNELFQATLPNGEYLINITFGDQMIRRDDMRVVAEGSLALEGVTTEAGEFTHRSFEVTVTDGVLDLEFQDAGGAGDFVWVANGVDIVPALVTTDGLTVTGNLVEGSGATPGEFLTVSVNRGAVTQADVGDAYQGVQVQADANGDFSFTIDPPQLGRDVVIVAEEVNARSRYEIVESFPEAPLWFDFNAEGSPTEDGYIGVLPTDVFDPVLLQYGWTRATGARFPDGFDRPAATGPDAELIRDGHFSTDQEDFHVVLPSGNYDVTVVMGDWSNKRDLMEVRAEGVQQVVIGEVARGEFARETFTVNVTDGVLDLQFDDLGRDQFWTLNAVVIEPATSLAPTLPREWSLDFEDGGETAPGFTSVPPSQTFDGNFGWQSPVAAFDTGATSPETRDGHAGQDATFQIAVEPNVNYTLSLDLFDLTSRSGIDISVEGAPLASGLAVVPGVPTTVTEVVSSGDGVLDLRFTGNPFVVNALQLQRDPLSLPADARAAQGASPGLAAVSLQPEQLNTAVGLAVAELAEHGFAVDHLQEVEFRVQDLGPDLGLASPHVVFLDDDAGGFGWRLPGAAAGGVDLSAAITHELGHVLGLEHDAHEHFDFMAPTLAPASGIDLTSRGPLKAQGLLETLRSRVRHDAAAEAVAGSGAGAWLDQWIAGSQDDDTSVSEDWLVVKRRHDEERAVDAALALWFGDEGEEGEA